MNWKRKLSSRKFWMAVGTILAVLLTDIVGIDLDPEVIKALVWACAAYVIGEGAVDAAREMSYKRYE